MDLAKLSRISMKHLITLHVMLDTLSVTASAERLCLSPSSVSKTLSQLRDSLNDELFYRNGNSLVATPLARRLGPSVQQMINDMNQIMSQDAFNPAHFEGRFSLAMRESTFELLAAKLSAHILNLAPHIHLDIYSKDNIGFDGLIKGSLDFVLLPHDLSQPNPLQDDLVWETLFSDEMVCLMNSSHPLAKQPQISFDDYLSYRHIGITDTDLSTPFFDILLAQQSKKRAVPISVPDFGSAALMCHHSELLFTCSRRWASIASQAKGLTVKSLPIEYGKVAYSLVWHRQSMKDPALRWLYEQILLCSR
ncbi:LysR family transcriptional regulator [Shewanella baltica]|uniref:LysR family transcriptional regulator n=1 Tax=Shewanella TaxID=22 RepID=UPI0001E10D9D|nr:MULTISPECIES: LysR family transcriptional regulator [Shewanella]AEG11386.1 transcriptional regulator, LysR family [Shewanella baltica BA175]EHQ15082.1 transcriptional regulator, LysR family [Shewanella baltica OS183]MCS6238503.1 LysR family transcriptional regulator [Shewanella baltica]MDR9766053.1 LysR family transcriptional regulator [Shewanella baltica]OUS53470.1 LysR family transcriptional regulator [Shewanella sp. SACH]